MSKFRVHKSVIQSAEAICDAIVDRIVQYKLSLLPSSQREKERAAITAEATQIVEESVVVSMEEPVNLYGYQSDRRDEKAHIRIPKEVVNKHLGGGLSNDAGFLATDDGFQAVISDYDNGKWWANSADRFWQSAAAYEAEEAAIIAGYTVDRIETEEGNIELVCTGY